MHARVHRKFESYLIGNIFYKSKGAYTGEISPRQAKSMEVDYAIVGHSERRKYFLETNNEINQKIAQKLYEEFEKGNSNTSQLLDWFQDEKIISHITEIMAGDFEITDVNKAIDDLISIYEKEKLISRRNEILKKLESVSEAGSEEVKELEKELNDIILKLAKIK